MRKTTIFRFSALVFLVGAGVPLTRAPLAAQDSTAAARGQVHIVGIGETLWTLAEFYLGDPHLWPEIYRLNTLVVEDPHWIFPGEELRLAPPDTVEAPDSPLIPVTEGPDVEAQAVETQAEVADPEEALPPPPPPPTATGPTVFARTEAQTRAGLDVARGPPPRPSGHLSYYSAGFLTEGESLPWGDVLGAADQSTLSTLRASSAATVFELVKIEAPENATYQVGDSLLIARFSRVVPGWGRIVAPTGIVQVTAVDRRNAVAQILIQFERVADGQVAMPLPTYSERDAVPSVIENGMVGSIIGPRDLHALIMIRNIVFIDRGRVDGIEPGDVFEALVGDPERGDPVSRIAVLEVVHTRERSASAVISAQYNIGVRAGTRVRLIRKMP